MEPQVVTNTKKLRSQPNNAMNSSHHWLGGQWVPGIPFRHLCDLILLMVLGGGCHHPNLKGWRSEKLHYLPKSCSLRAGIQRLASLIANSCLGSRNMLGNQSRSKWTPSPQLTGVAPGYSEWLLGLKGHAVGRYRTRLPFPEGSFSPPWKANP